MKKLLTLSCTLAFAALASCGDSNTTAPSVDKKSPEYDILFGSRHEGSEAIYRMNEDGSNIRTILVRAGNWNSVSQPSISADGQYIAFCVMPGMNGQIGFMKADSSECILLTRGSSPMISPDGSSIVFEARLDGDDEIYVIDREGKDPPRQLTHNSTYDNDPAWTPDGRIVYSSMQDGSRNIFIMNADGSNARNLLNEKNISSAPKVSSDGRSIVLSRIGADDNSWQIYSMDIDGANLKQLTKNNTTNLSPSWSPDGKKIAFISKVGTTGTTYDVFTVNADGSGLEQVTSSGTCDNPIYVKRP